MATLADPVVELQSAPQQPQQPPPSAKALGKRKQDTQSPAPSSTNNKRPQHKQLKQVNKGERRVTRSSLGGQNGYDSKGQDSEGEGAATDLLLPLKTPILLTTRLIPNLHHVPPPPSAKLPSQASTEAGPSSAQPPPSEAVADEAPRQLQEPDKPPFRLMDDSELLPPRGSRHAPAPEVDTSDAFYTRLHRRPEQLEKRASRLERERLIHERSKLIVEIEELRGRTWVYQGTSAGGRAEEQRQAKIREMEEKLARYDALLPNQPRKSNFLNLSAAAPAPPPAPAASTSTSSFRRSPTRSTVSPGPVLTAPRPRVGGPSTRANPAASTSTSKAAPHGELDLPRPSTPLSATASSAAPTKIRITFGPSSSGPSPAPSSPNPHSHKRPRPSASSTSANAAADPAVDLDLSRYTLAGELRKGPKRDRKAERARAEERRRLGLAPRANIEKHTLGRKVVKARPGEGRKWGAEGEGEEGEGEGEKGAGEGERERPRREGVKRARRESAARVTYAEESEEDEDEDEEDEEEEDELDDDEGEGAGADGEDGDELSELEEDELMSEDDGGEYGGTTTASAAAAAQPAPRRSRRPSSASAVPVASSSSHPAPLVRRRLEDSFFSSAALRDSIMSAHYAAKAAAASTSSSSAPTTSSRRSSNRVAYAFGQRLPDAALLTHADFEPHGGVSPLPSESSAPGHSNQRLEDLVRERAAAKGDEVVVLGGRVLPKSALDAWATGPLRFSPVKTASTAGTVSAPGSEGEAASRAASPAVFHSAAASGLQQRLVFAAPSPSPAPPSAPPAALTEAAPSPVPAKVEENQPPPPSLAFAPPPMSLSMPGSLPMDTDA
ncbi:hypothetical protein JCM8097_008651 [Rhodosporidiobolus ruineniae]